MNRIAIVAGALVLLATTVAPVLAEPPMKTEGAKTEASQDKHKGMENDPQHAQHMKAEQAKGQGTNPGQDRAKEPAPQQTSGVGSGNKPQGGAQKDGAMPAGDMGKM